MEGGKDWGGNERKEGRKKEGREGGGREGGREGEIKTVVLQRHVYCESRLRTDFEESLASTS